MARGITSPSCSLSASPVRPNHLPASHTKFLTLPRSRIHLDGLTKGQEIRRENTIASDLLLSCSQHLGFGTLDLELGIWDLGFPYTNVRLFMRGPNVRIRSATTTQHAAM